MPCSSAPGLELQTRDPQPGGYGLGPGWRGRPAPSGFVPRPFEGQSTAWPVRVTPLGEKGSPGNRVVTELLRTAGIPATLQLQFYRQEGGVGFLANAAKDRTGLPQASAHLQEEVWAGRELASWAGAEWGSYWGSTSLPPYRSTGPLGSLSASTRDGASTGSTVCWWRGSPWGGRHLVTGLSGFLLWLCQACVCLSSPLEGGSEGKGSKEPPEQRLHRQGDLHRGRSSSPTTPMLGWLTAGQGGQGQLPRLATGWRRHQGGARG